MSEKLSPTEPQWRRRKADRPGEITEAALACFVERGFAATRLEDVAKRAGVTKGTLYLYFPNKAELFKAVVRETILPNITRAEALVESSSAPARKVLALLLTEWSKGIMTPASSIPKIVLAEAGNFPEITRFYFDEVINRGRQQFRRVLQSGMQSGEFRTMDVERTIDCIVGPMLLTMLWQHSFYPVTGQAIDANALCRTLLDILAHGLAPGEPMPQSLDQPEVGAAK
ncbi:TetR/AcrR family transcriptional regulator [Methylovirgula sp. 4M-Z18]|uniref:TetR/AcrR family transcriptional regulator n=1 Tax=Methylovirgula sp. 4M-Z18 TaxID=2293567 RepID=UPI000E2F68FD|nr:TetR/AcrR family transcriptional regulator [Methylovirgula sp. 4M-Z18]RFB78013.1 TetR/AcrR family transcriptional regulator [Methylovirgula sp. 4M-Z18]